MNTYKQLFSPGSLQIGYASLKKAPICYASLCILLLFLSSLSSCKQDDLRVPLENDGVAPGPVSNVQVENLHGAARISYSIPADQDLLYVQADYEIRDGVKEEKKASFYDNFMVLEGFGDTTEHKVDLYAVDRGGNRSQVVTATVKPLLSPVKQAYDSLTYIADFGGVTVSFKNETQANIVITVMIKDSTGDWVDYDKDYTSQAGGNFSVRGLPAEPATFGVFIQDRWDNHSDTLVKTLTPLFEEELDLTKFKQVTLPSDIENIIWSFSDLWNANAPSNIGGFHSPDNGGFPAWFTFDMGAKAKLSRMKIWGIYDGREFSGGNVRHFQVWGSNDPNPDGSWDSWTLLGDFEVTKPSGLPVGQLSNEDVEAAMAGSEFSIPITAPASRYIRIKVLSSFALAENSKTGSFWIKRLDFWGNPEP